MGTGIILPVEYTGFLKDDQPLNKMQELVDPYKDEQVNIVLEAKTGSGKTTAICMCGYKYLFAEEPKKILYIAPMKALVEEKKRDWSNPRHPWSDLNLQIITGDYVDTWEDMDSLRNADIIVITPESLASRLRNARSDKSGFLNNIGLAVVDEAHLLGEPGRGSVLEAVLLELTISHPDMQLMMLSGTLNNADVITEWVSSLNNLETVHIKSDYRSTELVMEFYPYEAYTNGDMRLRLVEKIIATYPEAQMMIGVFVKSYGRKVEDHLVNKLGLKAEFHSADSTMPERQAMEKRFMSGVTQYMPCTSTLFVGMNLPPDHVIITAATDGGGDVPSSTLNQCAGRAGRPEFSDKGYAHFFLPAKNFEYHKQRIIDGEPVISQMQTVNDIAIHFLGAVYTNRIRKPEDFITWFKRTLRYHQYPISDLQVEELMDRIVADMTSKNMMQSVGGKLELRPRGEVVAQMAIDPYYLFDLICNMQKVLALPHPKTVEWAWALGATAEFYIPMAEVGEEARQLPSQVKGMANLSSFYWKGVSAYYYLMTSEDPPQFLRSMTWKARSDSDRIGVILSRLNNQVEMWKDPRVEVLPYRVKNGATEDEANFMAHGLTLGTARKLIKNGINTMKELRKNADIARGLFSEKKLAQLGII